MTLQLISDTPFFHKLAIEAALHLPQDDAAVQLAAGYMDEVRLGDPHYRPPAPEQLALEIGPAPEQLEGRKLRKSVPALEASKSKIHVVDVISQEEILEPVPEGDIATVQLDMRANGRGGN